MSDLWQQLIVRNQEAGPGGPGRSNRIRNRVLAGVAAAALLFVVGSVCTYTVPQTDLAFLTQFGRVVNRDAGPIGPGIHVKLPFVQHADMLTITQGGRADQGHPGRHFQGFRHHQHPAQRRLSIAV